MERRKAKYTIRDSGLGWLLGEFKKKKRRKKPIRTPETYQKKLHRLKKKYTRLSKSEKFKSKYSTFKLFLEKYNMREPSKTEEKRIVTSTPLKKGLWN